LSRQNRTESIIRPEALGKQFSGYFFNFKLVGIGLIEKFIIHEVIAGFILI
jgi:hypothetical protein